MNDMKNLALYVYYYVRTIYHIHAQIVIVRGSVFAWANIDGASVRSGDYDVEPFCDTC